MSMYGQFSTDKKLETKGVIIDYGSFRVTIARAGGSNKKYARVLEKKAKPYRRAMETETMNDDLARNMLVTVYAQTIILNWEVKVKDGVDDDNEKATWAQGIEAPDGKKPLPFTVDNVVKTFKALPELFLELKDQAEKVATFHMESVKDDSKN